MTAALLIITGPTLIWAICQRRLLRLSINGPVFMVFVGGIIGAFVHDQSTAFFDSKLALYGAEIILALLLFVDAIDIEGSLRSHVTSVPMRLLGIALPLSLALAVVVGLSLPLGLSVAAVLAIACLAVPVDFSPQLGILRDTRIPASVRRSLGIESGYNDGLVSPLLLAALALATTQGEPTEQATAAFLKAAPAGGIAILIGALTGTVAGWAFRTALRSGWCDLSSTRVGVLMLPLCTFALAVAVQGNGFVAAFVCGVTFRISLKSGAAQHTTAPTAFSLADDLAGVVNLLMWLVFGIAGVILVIVTVDWWPALILAGFVLTVGRIVPVLVSLIGSSTPWRDRAFMSIAGPRGAASIVFGLIAYNALPTNDGNAVLAATCIIIVASVALHGLSSGPLTTFLYGRDVEAQPVHPSPDTEHHSPTA